jgi:predicted nicotinamide N-methyase
LGAGCGLVGLVAAGIAASSPIDDEEGGCVVLTDFNPIVLENIRRNIALNPIPREITSVMALDFYQQTGDSHVGWMDGNEQLHPAVDVILAADIICQPSDAVAAANSIHDALKPGGCAYVVCADAQHRFGVDDLERECRRVGCTVVTQSVADLYQGRLLDCDTMLHLTAGYVDGMNLTLFEIRKPKL